MNPSTLDCSIVMLAHNGANFTRLCLNSLLHSLPLPKELIFANNGSTDGTADLLRQTLPKLEAAGISVKTWENDHNMGCSEGRNMAWAEATGKYVVFLDNDTAVCSRNWLARMAAELDRDRGLGVVGAKLIYPFLPHPIQCAGVGINRVGRIRFRGRGASRWDPRYLLPARVPALISACWMMRTRFLQDVGGLDPLFHPVQYEDLDYCFQLRRAGYHCAYLPSAEVYHFEGRTTGARGRDHYVRTIAENSIKFRRKWREELSRLPEDPNDFRWLSDEELGLTDAVSLRTSATSPREWPCD